MNATIEEQGMLKILEHIHRIIFHETPITFSKVSNRTGIEKNHWDKLIHHGLIKRTGSTNAPRYVWATIDPNIYMAKEVFKDTPDFTDSTNAKMVNAKNLAEHPYFKGPNKLIGTMDERKRQFINKYYNICKEIFDERGEPDYHIGNAAARALAVKAREEVGYSENTTLGDIVAYLHKFFIRMGEEGKAKNKIIRSAISVPKKNDFHKLEYKAGIGFHYNDVDGITPNGWGILHKKLSDNELIEFQEYFDAYEAIHPQRIKQIGEVADIFNTWRASKGMIERPLNIKFDDFWNLYDKKVGDKQKLEKVWIKLSDKDRMAIMEYIPKYKEAQPDKQFRKDPQTFLNNKSWNDEIISKTITKIIPATPPQNDYPLFHFRDQQLWDELKRRGYSGTINKSLS